MKLKGLTELGQGKWEYRKRVPVAAPEALGKSERKEVIEASSAKFDAIVYSSCRED